jgi:hypothetical protein
VEKDQLLIFWHEHTLKSLLKNYIKYMYNIYYIFNRPVNGRERSLSSTILASLISILLKNQYIIYQYIMMAYERWIVYLSLYMRALRQLICDII